MTPTATATTASTTSTAPRALLSQPLLQPIARLLPELSAYTLVSAAALTIDLIAFAALTRGGMRAALAGVIGYSIGLCVHYVLSLRYVFVTAVGSKSTGRRFIEFVVSGLIGVALTWGVIAIVADVLQWSPLVGKITAVAISFVVVFLLRKGIVFADRARAVQPDA